MGTEEVLCWEVYVESIMFSELREEGKGGGWWDARLINTGDSLLLEPQQPFAGTDVD